MTGDWIAFAYVFGLGLLVGLAAGLRIGFKLWRVTYVEAPTIQAMRRRW